jgi:7-cyano-7-deazaguanine synthase
VQELEAARKIASTCRVRFRVQALDIDGASSLTGEGELNGSSVVVPGRNFKMLQAASLMRPFPDALVFGACADDAEIFEDCRSEFFDDLRVELKVPIHTPLLDMTKKEVVELGAELGATNLVIMSWSCYAGGETPCRECGACLARAAGMAR